MENNYLVMLCGIPGSGKSSWAKNFFEKHPHATMWVSRDNIRFNLLKENEGYFSYEKKVFDTFVNVINKELEQNLFVIADSTNLTKKSRNKLLSRLNLEHTDIIILDFQIPLDDCLEHNARRHGREYVPISVIQQMFLQKETPKIEENEHIVSIQTINENGGQINGSC